MNGRLNNGVKARGDGGGDSWANEHRVELGRDSYLADFDGYIGQVAFAGNTGNRLFLEYAVRGTKGRKEFAIVALFDRKASVEIAKRAKGSLSTDLYLWVCRMLALHQSHPPKFFYVCGGNSAPWTMIELDIETGEEIGTRQVEKPRWKEVWDAFGLTGLRNLIVKSFTPQPCA